MPKRLHKSKHGQRGDRSEEPAREVSASVSGSASKPSKGHTARAHNGSASHSLSSKAELHQDKVLRKLCAKASEHHTVSKEGAIAPRE